MKTSIRLIQIFSVLASFLFYSGMSGQVAHPDSTLTDSTKSTIPDTLIKPRIPISLMGSIDRSLPNGQVITDSDKRFIDYRYLGDIISNEAGFSVLEFGATGQWQQLFSEGIDARGIQIMSDGAPLNDGTSGTYNLNFYPTENIERVEFIRGTEAYLYGINSPGGVINILSMSKKALRPYSHLRYSESAYGQAYIDGMLSQDLIRNLNMTAGAFHSTYGIRYLNSNLDQWNGRMKLRYNLNDNLDIAASVNYNQTYVGLFGGVQIASPDTAYNQFLATVENSDAYEKVTRHDMQLNIAHKFPGDSDGISTLTTYYSNQRRQYRDEENRFNSNGIFLQQDQPSRWYGIRIEHQRTIGMHNLTLGGEWRAEREYDKPADQNSNLFGIARIHCTDLIMIAPSARLDHFSYEQPADSIFRTDQSSFSVSYGSDISFRPASWFECFAGYSHSKRFPTFEFNSIPSVMQSSRLDPEENNLFETGFKLYDTPTQVFGIDFFHRDVKNAFSIDPYRDQDQIQYWFFDNHDKKVIQGFSIQTSLRLGSFILEGTAQYLDVTDPQDPVITFPRWSSNSGIYFWDTLLAHHLHLKTGIQVRSFTSYLGREFNQQALAYLPGGQEMDIPGSAIINLVVIAHLGDAYIHIILDNLFDRQYVMNTLYPMVDRSLRLGVSWEFRN